MTRKTICYGVAVALATLLIVGLTFAQSSQTTAARKSGSIIVLDKNASSATREAGSGQATGRRQHDPAIQTTNSRNSAHATESMDAHSSTGNAQVHTNPLYEDSGKSGSNPMYESGKQAIAKPNSSASGVVEYKDGEDMTTRYRPGNNKTTRSTDGSADAASIKAKKHVAGVKYEDRTAADPAGNQSNTSSSSNENFKQDFGQVQASKNTVAEPPQSANSNAQSGNNATAERRKLPGRMKSGNIVVTR